MCTRVSATSALARSQVAPGGNCGRGTRVGLQHTCASSPSREETPDHGTLLFQDVLPYRLCDDGLDHSVVDENRLSRGDGISAARLDRQLLTDAAERHPSVAALIDGVEAHCPEDTWLLQKMEIQGSHATRSDCWSIAS
jgi:hypothetical protein